MRLIDADELAVTYCEIDNQYHSEPWILDDILAFLNDAPTIEATPVVHGRWEKNEPDKHGNRKPKCSECGEYPLSWWSEYIRCSYCPNCGAKMDGGVSDG